MFTNVGDRAGRRRIYQKTVLAINSTTQSVNSGSTTVLTFDSEMFDNAEMHSNTVNTGRITFPDGGKFEITGYVNVPAGASQLYLEFRLNGSTVIRVNDFTVPTGDVAAFLAAFIYQFSPNDYLESRVFHNAGGARNVTASFGAVQILA